jgi:site-specific recombinase XerD
VNACVDCGARHRFKGSTRCHSCYDRRRRTGPAGVCARCTKRRPIHDPDGRCDWCVYACRPRPVVVVPPCVDCGQTRRIIAHGSCNRCLQKNPTTTRTYADGLAIRLGPARPQWYYAFVAHVVERYTPSEARLRLRELGRLLPTTADPAELVAAATHRDGRLAPLGRALDEFFDAFGPRPATGDSEARAAGRRARVLHAMPEPLRPMMAAFSAAELANRERARRTRGRILTDQTLLIHLQVVADFARHTPNITDWATVAQGDIEAFLVMRSPAASHVLPSLRAFFAWARQQRLILVDPTRKVRNRLRRRFSGPVVDLPTQRRLFRRWTTEPDVAPNEALVGLLTLLHAASVNDLRHLTVTDINHTAHTITLPARSRPVPLDPPTWAALQAVLAHHHNLNTTNPHVLVNRRTKVTGQPVSASHPTDILAPAGITPQRLRCSRLAQLVTTTDPIIVTEQFGISHATALYYLADSVDHTQLFPNP